MALTPVQVQTAQNKLVRTGPACKLDYLHVDLRGYGIPDCIIFRPANLPLKDDAAFLVEIVGVKDIHGRALTARYVVEFFKP